MTPDHLTRAEADLDAAQQAYDAALTAGVGLLPDTRHGLAERLATARRDLRAAVCGIPDAIDETRVLTYMLPALELVTRADEE